MIPATAYVASLLGSDCITTTGTRRTSDIRRRAETAPICKEQEAAVWNSDFFLCTIALNTVISIYFHSLRFIFFGKVSHITF